MAKTKVKLDNPSTKAPLASVKDFLVPSRRQHGYLERNSIVQALAQLSSHVQHGKILDVGCGMKPYESLLSTPGEFYVGIDYPTTMANSYKQATRADVFANSLALPFLPASFDSVVSTQVLEHVAHPALYVGEIARVLRPGGSLLLSAPMTWPLHEEPHDFYRYTVYGLRHLLAQAGLEVVIELQRGAAPATLGQMFLVVHLENLRSGALFWKLYRNGISLLVNCLCSLLDWLWPKSKLCLGWVVVARKPRLQ